jgi:transcriptional regulator with XRE-family HTH domain
MSRLLPSYLHTLRKQWGLSQPDLAALFDVSGSAMSRFENLSRRPTVELVIGAEVVFGHTAKEVFPALYKEIEHSIVDRARVLRDGLETKTDPATRQKLRLLSEIIERAEPTKLTI